MLTTKLNKNTNSGKVIAALSIVAFVVINMAMLPRVARAGGSELPFPPAFYNVYDYGAKGDGTTDDTGPFQNALNAAQAGGGGIVLAPRGTYKINLTLSIPAYVTLKGVFVAPPEKPYVPGVRSNGTILLAYSGYADTAATPFIQLAGDGSTLQGLTIFYPNQGIPFVPFPWTIRGCAHNNAVLDVVLTNSYRGVDFATNSCSRHLIRGLYGVPLNIGIRVDKCFDIGRIEDVHFCWEFWKTTGEELCPYMVSASGNARALVLMQSDWEIVNNFFAFGYHVGVQFLPGYESRGTNGQFTNLNIDASDIGIDIYHIEPYGVQISNLNIACTNDYQPLPQSTNMPIWGHYDGNGSGSLSIVNGSFWGAIKAEAIRWDVGGHLNVSSSFLRDWDANSGNAPAINILGGRATIQGNYFKEQVGVKRAVYIASTADRVIVHGNQLTGNTIDPPNPPGLRLIQDNLQ